MTKPLMFSADRQTGKVSVWTYRVDGAVGTLRIFNLSVEDARKAREELDTVIGKLEAERYQDSEGTTE